MKITALSEYKGDTWYAELDGGKKFFVNVSVVDEFRLREGMELSSSALESVKNADVLRKAKKRAVYLLGERAYCRGEMLKKLTAAYGEEIAEEAADYVCELGYINDEEYAPKLADYMIKRKRWGIRRVRFEMLRKGLDRELVENTLADISEEAFDEELAELIRKKYYAKIEDYDDRRRTIAALARRGYDFGTIKRCIDAVLEEYGDSDQVEFDENIEEDY